MHYIYLSKIQLCFQLFVACLLPSEIILTSLTTNIIITVCHKQTTSSYAPEEMLSFLAFIFRKIKLSQLN